jgi:hypothetical protein
MVLSNHRAQPVCNHLQETQQPASLNKTTKSHRNKNLCHYITESICSLHSLIIKGTERLLSL